MKPTLKKLKPVKDFLITEDWIIQARKYFPADWWFDHFKNAIELALPKQTTQVSELIIKAHKEICTFCIPYDSEKPRVKEILDKYFSALAPIEAPSDEVRDINVPDISKDKVSSTDWIRRDKYGDIIGLKGEREVKPMKRMKRFIWLRQALFTIKCPLCWWRLRNIDEHHSRLVWECDNCKNEWI